MQSKTRLRVNIVTETLDASVLRTFGRIRQSGARPMNIHGVLANSPDVFDNFINFAYALRSKISVEPADRELAILRILELGDGDYELRHHRPMGSRAGLSAEAIRAVGEFDALRTGVFTDRQIAMLNYVDQFADRSGIDIEVAQELRRHFDDRQIVELSLTLALYSGLASFTKALDVPID